MNIELIRALIKEFEQSTLSKLNIETPEIKVAMEKAISGTVVPVVEQRSAPMMESTCQTIKAPVVGTFYHAAAPDAQPFIKVGQVIKPGDVIGIIEAMKVMNEITSDIGGTVSEILVPSGGVVGYQQALVKVV